MVIATVWVQVPLSPPEKRQTILNIITTILVYLIVLYITAVTFIKNLFFTTFEKKYKVCYTHNILCTKNMERALNYDKVDNIY